MNERIEQLEIKVAFLEQANSQLGEEIFRLRQSIEAVQAQMQALTGRFDAAAQAPTDYAADDERPPHY